MKVIKQKAFDGRNIYSHKKCIRADVDLQGYSEIPSKDIPEFNSKILTILPELHTHRCGIDEDGGFVKRLKEGTYLAHICEHMIIAIQNKLGLDVVYGKAREIKDDLYYIIFQYEYKTTGLEVLRLAVDIINSVIKNEEINFENRFNIIEEILNDELIGPSTKAIKNAALRYGLPVAELGDSGFYQIGYGKQARIIEATIGAITSCVATDIACDKVLTKELLTTQNIPVADGGKVYNIINLLSEGERIGYPLVLKPRYGSKGQGVIVNITSEQELVKGYNSLKDKYKEILVEKYIEGNDYRVCVIDYNVIAVSLRIPPKVVGNGIDNVKQLIRNLNKDSRRGYDHEKQLTMVKIDDELLRCIKSQGVSLVSIPIEGEQIALRENANLSTGGMAVDYTDKICKENKELCIRAAKAIGLDICGIDITTSDISKPIYGNGVIMEINAAPGIRMHHYPSEGMARDVGDAILRLQYNGVPNNIPVISITGTNGKTTTTRLISHVFKSMGYKVGMTSTEGIYIDDDCIDKGDDTGYYSAKSVLQNRDVEVAVLETARGGMIKRGLAYDLADVAVITNITEDHLGLDDIETMEDLCKVKSLVGEAVKEYGYTVINADDKWSKTILDRIRGNKVFFSKDKENQLIKDCIENNGIAVYVEDNQLCVTNNNRKYKVMNIDNIPITFKGILDFNIENAMAACGALVASGVDYCMISKAFKSFKPNSDYNSGRFNMYHVNGTKVILDYGHNIEGYTAVLKSLSKMKKDKLIGIVGIPGDRQDSMALKIGNICAEYMDYIYIKEDEDRRGRNPNEIASLIKQGIEGHNSGKAHEVCLDEIKALKSALDKCGPEDVIIVFYENMEPLIEVINKYRVDYQNDIYNVQ